MSSTGIPRGAALLAVVAYLHLTCSASADVAVYDLVAPNSDLSSYHGPFLQVTVNLKDSTHATITFDSLKNGGYQYLLTGGVGSPAQAAFANVSGTFTLASFSGTPFNGTTNALSSGGSGSVNGFGSFDETVRIKDNILSDSYTEVVLTVAATGTTSWEKAANVLASNGDQQILAAHVGALASGGTGFNQTGFVAGAVLVPEPSTLAMACLGAIAFASYGLRRRSG
jgi:hypothetical protein